MARRNKDLIFNMNSELQQTSPLPIYWRIYSILREEIIDGHYNVSVALPSEDAIAERFSTSRLTVRKAMDLLKSEGYLATRRGVGTFVAATLPPGSEPHSFTSNLTDMWKQTETKLLEFGMIAAPADAAAALEVEQGDLVHKAIRLRSYKGRPIGLLTTFIQERLAKNYTPDDFMGAPLFKLFLRDGSPSVTARQRISARSADPFSAEHLEVEIGSPILCVRRISYDIDGKPISFLRSHFRHDRYEIEWDLEVDTVSQKAIWRGAGSDQKDMPNTALFDLDPN